MNNKVNSVLPRVNFFDGQRVTESDFDSEQLHNQSVFSGILSNFHGSGVVKDNVFESNILFDSSKPGFYAPDGATTSKDLVEAGNFDGKPVLLDLQPSDLEYGNRLQIYPHDLNIMGREKLKVLVIGYSFDSINTYGQFVYEVLTFSSNKPKLTKHYYKTVKAVLFNNFSGGIGKNEYVENKESLNLAGSGKIIISEADSFVTYEATSISEQVASPSFDLLNFITYSNSVSIEDLIKESIGSDTNFNDLYFELSPSRLASFEKNESVLRSYGQKFLAKSTTIQKVELLLSVNADETLPIDEQFDFSGQLVVSIHKVLTEIRNPTDVVPDNLIGFDPDIDPIIEISISQDDLLANGVTLNDKPSIINFDFSSTLIADASLEPNLEVDAYYAVVISRRGDTSKGTINLFVGYDEPSRRGVNGQPKNAEQEFGIQNSRFIEFDQYLRKWVDYSDLSLWHRIHSECVEVTPGTAYSDDGYMISIPKYEEFVGDTKISRYIRNIPLSTIISSQKNYLVLEHIEKFVSPSTHPRTGNFVFTRIFDTGIISVLNEADFSDAKSERSPLLISTVQDTNVRSAEIINGQLDKPGLIDRDYVLLVSPDENLFSENLINRIFTPDNDCSCNAKYRIIKTECLNFKLGDINNDSVISNLDIDEFISYTGNTINSLSTERKIISGDLSYIKFKQADLDKNGTIDSIDIEYMELAIDGNIAFEGEKEFKVLKLYLENIVDSSNNPTIFTDSSLSGEVVDASSTLIFVVDDYRKALAIRVGDIVSISDETVATGLYTISSKTLSDDMLTVTVTLLDADGNEPSFVGASGFNLSVFSGTNVNTLSDNLGLCSLPFALKNWSIDFISNEFSGDFFEICDLRRFVAKNIIEEITQACFCNTSPCQNGPSCGPVLRNQKYFPGDVYVPNGNILSSPGVPHHGDFEYMTITMPMPPGSIDDCQVDLYNTFIKSSGTTCLTVAGYPAMKYSDGTYVGCEDTGLQTDITKGRIKFTSAIASLHVDALVDGYAVDGYADATSTSNVKDLVGEEFIDNSYNAFDTWSSSTGSATEVSITNDAGPNNPAKFLLTTTTSSGERFGSLEASELQALEGDILIDIKSLRAQWSSTLPQGTISSFIKLVVTNDDLTSTVLKLGWMQSGVSDPVLYWSGHYYDSTSTLVFTFESTAQIPDEVGEEILFRIKRIDDAFFAYYINPLRIMESATPDAFGQYIRIGSNPSRQPGSGTVAISIGMDQKNNPVSSLVYEVWFKDLQARSLYSTSIVPNTFELSKVSSTGAVKRATLSFPIMITQRTNIISAKMILTSTNTVSSTDFFNVIPLAIINASNILPHYNYPIKQDMSYIQEFSPGSLLAGDQIEVDITDIIKVYMSEPGFLPGTFKAIMLEPTSEADSSIVFDPSVTFEIEYEDITTGVIFKVGISVDPTTGIASFKTKNILYDASYDENRTVIKFGVMLKKAGFKNNDINVSISDLKRIGIGTCNDESLILDESSECYFIVGSTSVGTFVEGPFPCSVV